MPATGTGITDGVMEVVLTGRVVSGIWRKIVEEWVDNVVIANFGNLNQWNHLMYVFPENVDFGTAAAYAQVNGYKSVYKGAYASLMGVQVHELGHNYDMRHSGFGDATYLDHTGLMGTFSPVSVRRRGSSSS
jgi:hypothetical protein